MRLVVLSVLSAVTTLLPASAPRAQVMLPPADSTVVRAASALAEESSAISEVWPGFWSDTPAFLVLRPTETALLVTPRTPPATYVSVPARQVPSSLAGRAYLRSEYPSELGSRTFDTRYVVGRDTVPALHPKGSSFYDRLDFYLHESFHGYQRGHWTATSGDTMRVGMGEHLVDASITEEAAFRARAEVERRILATAIDVDDGDSLRSLVRVYRAVRRARISGRDRVRAVERSMERREGTATYVGCRAAAAATASNRVRSLNCIREHLDTPLDSLDNFPEADASIMRWRLYGTGAALCVVLDSLGVRGWKERVENGAALDELIVAGLGRRTDTRETDVQSVLDRFGYSAILRQLQDP